VNIYGPRCIPTSLRKLKCRGAAGPRCTMQGHTTTTQHYAANVINECKTRCGRVRRDGKGSDHPRSKRLDIRRARAARNEVRRSYDRSHHENSRHSRSLRIKMMADVTDGQVDRRTDAKLRYEYQVYQQRSTLDTVTMQHPQRVTRIMTVHR
jgi:hypothetical protein